MLKKVLLCLLPIILTLISLGCSKTSDETNERVWIDRWYQERPMNMSRSGLGAISVGKRIYAIGGGEYGNKGLKILNSVEYTDVLDDGLLGEWKFTSPLKMPRIYVSTVVYGDYIYVMGGESLETLYTGGLDEEAPALLDSVERAKILPDGTLGEWILAKERMNFSRRGGELFAHNGWLYAVGGYNGAFLNDVEKAKINSDGSLGKWVREKNLINGTRYISGYVKKGNRFYLLGGHLHTAERAMDSVGTAEVRPDSTITEWKETTPMSTRRFLNTALIIGDTIYAITGQNSIALTSTERATILKDGSLSQWVPDTPLNIPRRAAAAVEVGNTIYVMGGDLGHMGREFSIQHVESASVPRSRTTTKDESIVPESRLGYWVKSDSPDFENYKTWKKSVPFDSQMHLKKARENLSKKKYDSVLFDTSEALKTYPEFFEAYNVEGDAYYRMGKVDLAIDALKKSLAIREDNFDALIGLGTINFRKEQLSEAITYYKRAVQSEPDSVAAHDNLGNAYLSQGDYGAAAKEFQWILEREPDSVNARQHLELATKEKE